LEGVGNGIGVMLLELLSEALMLLELFRDYLILLE
jgi:hypothetical protein